MTTNQAAKKVKRFYAERFGAGLILPNGWFGRPYDNLHQLTACAVAEDTLRIELDGQQNLTFEGPGLKAIRDKEGLSLGGYSMLSWDWRSYGSSNEHHHQVFMGGEVRFIVHG